MKRLLTCFVLVASITSLWGAVGYIQPVNALSECVTKIIQRDSSHFDECVDEAAQSQECSGTSSLSGSDNEAKVYNFLIGKGLKPQQAAGIMGNIAVESNFVPNNQQNGLPWPTGGWGIAQWTNPERRDRISKETVAAGLPYVADKSDGGRDLTPAENEALLQFQLNFLYKESNERTSKTSPGKIEWDALKEINIVKDAVVYWEANFERAGEPALAARIAAGNELFAKYGSSEGADTTSSGDITNCELGAGGEVVGGWSFIVDRKWYKQVPTEFTAKHAGYPAVDIGLPAGTPVYAVTGGKVTRAPIVPPDSSGNTSSYGLGVEIEGVDGVRYIYGHGLDGGSVQGAKQGDTVKPGQLIMHVGSTGNSTGNHIHFEILRKGDSTGSGGVCPQSLLVGIIENKVPAISSLPDSGCTE